MNFCSYGCLFLFLPLCPDSEEGQWDEATQGGPEEKASVATALCALLASKSDLLQEYFQIGFTSDLGALYLVYMPELLAGYRPLPAALPLFLLRLGVEVEWEDEHACFEGVSRELALCYSALPTHATETTMKSTLATLSESVREKEKDVGTESEPESTTGTEKEKWTGLEIENERVDGGEEGRGEVGTQRGAATLSVGSEGIDRAVGDNDHASECGSESGSGSDDNANKEGDGRGHATGVTLNSGPPSSAAATSPAAASLSGSVSESAPSRETAAAGLCPAAREVLLGALLPALKTYLSPPKVSTHLLI